MRKVIVLWIVLISLLSSCALRKNTKTTDESVVINGVKWTTRNVDAFGTFAKNKKNAGMFYQWNRKIAWNATDSTVVNWDDTCPKGTEWEMVNNPCPQGWRVPTREDYQTLLDTAKVSYERCYRNNVGVFKFTDKANSKSLFFPVGGVRIHDTGALVEVNHVANYWSSTANGDNEAYVLAFSWSTEDEVSCFHRGGHSVRCVAE